MYIHSCNVYIHIYIRIIVYYLLQAPRGVARGRGLPRYIRIALWLHL